MTSSRLLDTLCDEVAGVRKGGRKTSVRCVGEMREAKPFAMFMAATLNAGLSYLRTELRVEAARATVEILEAGKVGREVVFGGGGNPMEALKELVVVVRSDKAGEGKGDTSVGSNELVALYHACIISNYRQLHDTCPYHLSRHAEIFFTKNPHFSIFRHDFIAEFCICHFSVMFFAELFAE
ncbi:unnamed protein product [Chondrus crispus]|uniref:Uncharacterized protein n=1 Tax=Chondrus crispus TaxID=2769 RepID=R7QFQ1_CHOCR|nr:unnamed protein product [Chondrus crispus]CDF36578.1 unnamed protein product [Chondrus crispus]|eukprot:XP_005716397.1 unnamed protein product [Chondrus crispus]